MDKREKTQSHLSDEITVSIDNFTKRLKEIPQFKIPEIKIPLIKLSDEMVNRLNSMNNLFENLSKEWQAVAKKLAESENKRESNFYYVREEESYRYGKRYWDEFKEWYKEFVIYNPAYYYDIAPWRVLHTTDENTLYTNPETNTTIKLIGVNSVSYELFFLYKEKCHEAQKQGLKWSDENEKKRIEKFIRDVKVEQPKQLQEADETIHEKIIKAFEKRDEKNANSKSAQYYFTKKSDFVAFTDALAIHLSNEEYNLPNSIHLRGGGIAKIAKAVYDVYLNSMRTSLSDDTQLFDLMRVLSSFENKSNIQIYYDMQRTK